MLSVGSIFSRERKRRELSLKDVEKQTRIREKFLLALEENNWDAFSSKIYISGLIKNYARFLDLDTERMTAYFRRDYERREEIKFKKRVESKYFKTEKKKFVIAGILILFLVFSSYFGYQVYLYLSPPKGAITGPSQSVFPPDTEKIPVRGKTEADAVITIFGERVYQNKEGEFEYDFPLQQGKNRIVIEITGANGKKTTIEKTYTLE